MQKSLLTLPLLALILLILCNTTTALASHASMQRANISSLGAGTYKSVRACDQAAPGFARCLAIIQKPTGVHPSTAAPAGLTPSNLQQAYRLPTSATGKGQTIAVIDAYDNPNAEKDMATYRAMFHISSCTTSNGCFKKVDQNGSTHYPTPDSGWAGEVALDLDMISAIAPNSHILLIEATSASYNNLGLAVNTAVRMGAQIITNSYGGQEDQQSVNTMAHYYNHPGVTIVASAGDSGYSVQLPAAYNTVIAVGGTSLTPSSNVRGWSETAWNGSGSGCSKYVSKPQWQKDSLCKFRTMNDISAVANPDTGVAVYDTYQSGGNWFIYGGTSVSSPIIAGIYALAGNATSINASYLYSHTSKIYDIVSGSNGSCQPSYLCTAGNGYDGPTGLGTPAGIGAF